jgi:tetratricopeptide (TPR) repeat protein
LTYNFVQRSAGAISMHRLVQDVMRDLISSELQDQARVLDMLDEFDRVPQYWVQRAIELISTAYPASRPDTWSECEAYNSHATCCITYGKQYALEFEEFADLQTAVGKYTYDQGGYTRAKELFESALKMYENLLPDNSLRLADAFQNHGRALAQLGKYQEALHQYDRAMSIRNHEHDDPLKDDICGAEIMGDIGKSLFGLGKYDEAIRSFEKGLKMTENLDHLKSANLIALIGAVYLSKKQPKNALVKCQQALSIQERVLGKDHIDSAGLVCLLGTTLHRRGHYRKALQKYEQALSIFQKTFGDNHIKSADALDAMGLSFLHLGKCQQAMERFQRALTITENVYGKDHIKSEGPIFNMGASCLFSGRAEEALGYYERADKLYREKICAEQHPERGTNTRCRLIHLA